MGIPSYFSYIISNYPNIIKNWKQINSDFVVNYLFMDCNSIIYDEYRKMENEDNINYDNIENILINNVASKIGDYIKYVSPTDLVYIAFDGVAPFAKMEQQRNRRYKNGIISKMNDIIRKTTTVSKWSTSNITPGTQFMFNLSNKIKKIFTNTEQHYKTKKIIVSGSIEEGEGEHKMFQYIRNNKKSINGNAFVYGLDSDLIMLSLFHKTIFSNLFIFRETPEFGKIANNNYEKSDYLFMNISILGNAILQEMNCDVYDSHRLYDYIFMCFLLGNDFLPHFPSLNIRTCGIDVIMDIYRKVIGKYSNRTLISLNMTIQWRNVSIFINELAKRESERFNNEHTQRDKISKRNWGIADESSRDFTVQSVPIIYKYKENYIDPRSFGWESRYYKSLFSKGETYNIKPICINYLEGLEWVFKYYTDDCPDWKWSYKYHYPPLLKDLCKFIPNKFFSFIKPNKNKPFSPSLQLAYVLPKSNHHLLPSNINNYIDQHEKEYYPTEFEFEWAYCKYFWESHAILPEVPLHILEKWDKMWVECV